MEGLDEVNTHNLYLYMALQWVVAAQKAIHEKCLVRCCVFVHHPHKLLILLLRYVNPEVATNGKIKTIITAVIGTLGQEKVCDADGKSADDSSLIIR